MISSTLLKPSQTGCINKAVNRNAVDIKAPISLSFWSAQTLIKLEKLFWIDVLQQKIKTNKVTQIIW